jgi:hypothetical protein
MVCPVYRVSVIVGEVRKDLEKYGRSTTEKENQSIEFVLSGRQKPTHADARQ